MELSPAAAASPYREVFSELESRPYSTSEAYELFYNWASQTGTDPSIYLSMAITSGGFACDPELAFPEVMQNHTEYGNLMAQAVTDEFSHTGYISREDVLAPADLGKVPGWEQADFLLFWAHVITGLDPREAAHLDAIVRASGVMEQPGFKDKSLPREEKWQDYAKLIETYVSAFEQTEAGMGKDGMRLPRNIQAVVLILDTAASLGVNAERYLCHLLGLGEWMCELREDKLPERTIEMMGRLSSLGAHILPFTRFTDVDTISGRQNRDNYLRLRARGVRWRKSGILSVVERKELERRPPYGFDLLPQQSAAEQWAEYFGGTLLA